MKGYTEINSVDFVTFCANDNSLNEAMEKFDNSNKLFRENNADYEVIARILNGEKELYGVIVRRYNSRLYRVGMSIINDDSEVEDIMQTTYIKAYENLGKFAFQAAFSTWLTRIMVNECILRRKKRRFHVDINEEIMKDGSYRKKMMEVQTPMERTVNNELKVRLENAIHQLPEKYRVIFVMREVEGMNVAETMSCLNISKVNVKVRLNRAKAMLKSSLIGYYHPDEVFHFHLSRCDKMLASVMIQLR